MRGLGAKLWALIAALGVFASISPIYGLFFVAPTITHQALDPDSQFRFPFNVANKSWLTFYDTTPTCRADEIEFGDGASLVGISFHDGALIKDLPPNSSMEVPCQFVGDDLPGITIFGGDGGKGVRRLKISIVVDYKLGIAPGVRWERSSRSTFLMRRQKNGTPVWFQDVPQQ